jgi:multidrug efflux system membrane fusion protein
VRAHAADRAAAALVFAGLALAGLALAAGCGGSESAQAPAGLPPVEAALAAAEEVSAARALEGSIRSVIPAPGSVRARRTTGIAAGVPGRLGRVYVDVGDRVAAGQPLFEIDAEPYRIALAEAEAGLSLARAEDRQARQEAERARKLAEQNIVAPQALERTHTSASIAAARLQQAGARVRRARHDLDRTVERAPYAGSIVERHQNEGAMVAASAPVVVLQESGALEVVLDVPEATRPRPSVGDPVRVFLEGIPGPLETEIHAVSDRIDPESRTFTVRASISAEGTQIKAGGFVRAEIAPRATSRGLVVDRSALLRRQGRPFVFQLDEGVARLVPVELGVESRTQVEVTSGLERGALVAVGSDAVARLADGAQVRPVLRETGANEAPAGEGPAP